MNNEEKILQILSTMQTDMVEMKADMVEMKADMVEMKADMVEMKADMVEMKDRLVRVEDRLVRVEDRLVRVELAVENDIPQKIGMLADGHIQLTEQIQRLENKVDAINERTKTLTVTRASTRDVSDLRQRVVALEDLWDVTRFGHAL